MNIHVTRGHEKDLDLIAAAGFKVVRMDFAWSAIERRKGEYDWSAYDELTTALEKRGLRPLYIFDYSNRLYEQEVLSPTPVFGKLQRDIASLQHPDSIAAFARWTAIGGRWHSSAATGAAARSFSALNEVTSCAILRQKPLTRIFAAPELVQNEHVPTPPPD